MFGPLVLSYLLALAVSMVVALTVTAALCSSCRRLLPATGRAGDEATSYSVRPSPVARGGKTGWVSPLPPSLLWRGLPAAAGLEPAGGAGARGQNTGGPVERYVGTSDQEMAGSLTRPVRELGRCLESQTSDQRSDGLLPQTRWGTLAPANFGWRVARTLRPRDTADAIQKLSAVSGSYGQDLDLPPAEN